MKYCSGSTCHKGGGDQNEEFKDTDEEQGLGEKVGRAKLGTKGERKLCLLLVLD